MRVCHIGWKNARTIQADTVLWDRYKFQTQVGTEDKVATLSDADNVWTEIRHMHMREAIDKLMADFNQFLQDNAGFKGSVIAHLKQKQSFNRCRTGKARRV